MHLVQLLLPLYDNDGNHFPPEPYRVVRTELSERFGGLTAFTSAPAEGLWTEDGKTSHDEIVIFEVMAESLERDWWRDYRQSLERRFRQDEVVIRATAVERI